MTVKIELSKPTNLDKLRKELAEAGYKETSANGDGRRKIPTCLEVIGTDDSKAVMAIYDKHDPKEVVAKSELELMKSDIASLKTRVTATEGAILKPRT
jgi:hypothetical protein